MIHKKNIILTGELHCGKSTLVRQVLDQLKVDYAGIFSEPLYLENSIIGYGLRMVGEPGIDIFAHIEIHNLNRFGQYGFNNTAFERAVGYIKKSLKLVPKLFVIDEVGLIEKVTRAYVEALHDILSSATPSLIIVQKRSEILVEIKQRKDVIIFELKNNHIELKKEIIRYLI